MLRESQTVAFKQHITNVIPYEICSLHQKTRRPVKLLFMKVFLLRCKMQSRFAESRMLDVQFRHSRCSVVSVLVPKSVYVRIPGCKSVFQALLPFLLVFSFFFFLFSFFFFLVCQRHTNFKDISACEMRGKVSLSLQCNWIACIILLIYCFTTACIVLNTMLYKYYVAQRMYHITQIICSKLQSV